MSWPHLLRPGWLLLVPLLVWLLWRLWRRQRRVGQWQRLLPPAFQAVLLTGGRRRSRRAPWVLLGLGWLLALLILLGPSWQRLEQPVPQRDDPLVVMLELTPAMLAADLPPTRLEHARRKLLDLLQARDAAPTGVVVFAGSAHTLVPLSNDLATTRNLLDALTPSLMPEAGHRADLALTQALHMLTQAGQGRGRLLLITTGLDETERLALREQLGRRGERLSILGIGTAQGAPIVAEDGSFLKDAEGTILIPRLDSATLGRFAEAVGGRYQSARLDNGDLAGLGLLDPAGPLHLRAQPVEAWQDQGYWLLLPLLLLAACAGRRGWLLCLPLLLPAPPAGAFELIDLWLRQDQQGQRLLDAGRPAEAARHFTDPQRQGLALYLAGEHAAAAERFARGDSAADHYNRGNALARSGALQAALEAYEQALERQPGLEPAQRNRALVEEWLRQREPAAQPTASDTPHAAPTAPTVNGPSSRPAEASRAPAARTARPANPAAGNREQEPAGGNAVDEPAAPAQPQEQRDAAEQWLRRIPDDPGELLRRKFLLEQRQRQDNRP